MERWKAYICGFFAKKKSYAVDAWSGSSAFFIVISFFPFILLVFSLFRHLYAGELDFLTRLASLLPQAARELVTDLLREADTRGETAAVSVSAAAALWTASRSMFAVSKGLSAVYGTRETRGYLKSRIIAFAYTAVFFAVLAVMLGILVFGRALVRFFVPLFPGIRQTALWVLTFRSGAAAVLLTVFFLLLYKVLPNNPMRLRALLPGALFSACGWLVFSRLFSLYIDHGSHSADLYGSLTAVVLLMLWLYVCMYILFLGGVLNVWLADLQNH